MNGKHNDFRETPSEVVKRLTERLRKVLACLDEKTSAMAVVRRLNHARATQEELDCHRQYVKSDIVEPLKNGLAFLSALCAYRACSDEIVDCKPIFEPESLPKSQEDNLVYHEVLEECCIIAGDDIDAPTMLRILQYAAPSREWEHFLLSLGTFTLYYVGIAHPERAKALRRERGFA